MIICWEHTCNVFWSGRLTSHRERKRQAFPGTTGCPHQDSKNKYSCTKENMDRKTQELSLLPLQQDSKNPTAHQLGPLLPTETLHFSAPPHPNFLYLLGPKKAISLNN